MKTPIILLLGATISLAPTSVLAQTEASPAATEPDPTLVAELCASVAVGDNETAACIADVEAALSGMAGTLQAEGPTVRGRAEALADDTGVVIDEALEEVLEVDFSAAFDDALATLDEIDLDGAVDAALASLEDLVVSTDVNVRAVIDEAVDGAMTSVDELDISTAIEEALAEADAAIEDAGLEARVDAVFAALDDRIADARTIADAAQTWARENPEAVCLGSSLGLGATAGLVIVAVTGIEPLGLQAFRTTEQFTNDLCSDVVGG